MFRRGPCPAELRMEDLESGHRCQMKNANPPHLCRSNRIACSTSDLFHRKRLHGLVLAQSSCADIREWSSRFRLCASGKARTDHYSWGPSSSPLLHHLVSQQWLHKPYRLQPLDCSRFLCLRHRRSKPALFDRSHQLRDSGRALGTSSHARRCLGVSNHQPQCDQSNPLGSVESGARRAT
jgi:hypothetical protein